MKTFGLKIIVLFFVVSNLNANRTWIRYFKLNQQLIGKYYTVLERRNYLQAIYGRARRCTNNFQSNITEERLGPRIDAVNEHLVKIKEEMIKIDIKMDELNKLKDK